MLKKFGIVTGLLLGMLVSPLHAEMLGNVQGINVVEQIGEGEINWTLGTVQVAGIGAPPASAINVVQAAAMAERAAITVARRNLLEIVKGVRVDSETRVENFVATSDVIKTKVRGFVQGARVVEKRNLTSGGVEVVMEVKLRGPFADTLLPKVIHTEIPPAIATSQTKSAVGTGKVYTGMVVDARGLDVRPAMAPKILNEKGEEVYGSAYVNRDYAIQQGMVGYSRNLESAGKNDRVTDIPLLVKGIKAAGNSNTDIVISDADAQTLQTASQNLKFLQQCRVMIVVD